MIGKHFDLDAWIDKARIDELDPVPVPQPDAKLTATRILGLDEGKDMPTDIPEHDPVHYRRPRWWAIAYAVLVAFMAALVFHYFK